MVFDNILSVVKKNSSGIIARKYIKTFWNLEDYIFFKDRFEVYGQADWISDRYHILYRKRKSYIRLLFFIYFLLISIFLNWYKKFTALLMAVLFSYTFGIIRNLW